MPEFCIYLVSIGSMSERRNPTVREGRPSDRLYTIDILWVP
jgi:hypothetical protein